MHPTKINFKTVFNEKVWKIYENSDLCDSSDKTYNISIHVDR